MLNFSAKIRGCALNVGGMSIAVCLWKADQISPLKSCVVRFLWVRVFRGWLRNTNCSQPKEPTAIVSISLHILWYRKDPKKNILQWGMTRSNSPKCCPNVSKTVVWYLRICKRTYRIWRIAISADASEQSQILYVLCYWKQKQRLKEKHSQCKEGGGNHSQGNTAFRCTQTADYLMVAKRIRPLDLWSPERPLECRLQAMHCLK